MSSDQHGPKEAARELTRQALNRLSPPFTEDVIKDVWVEILGTPDLARSYKSLRATYGVCVDQLIPQTTREETNLLAARRVKAPAGLPVKTYTKLLQRG